MLRLAVATDAETLERIRDPLGERGIAARHLRAKERSIHVADGGDGGSGSGGTDGASGPSDSDGASGPGSGDDASDVGDANGVDPSKADHAFDVGFVYPSRLMEGGALDARLSIPWVNGRDAVVTSRNKAGVIAALDAAGIPVPRTTMLSNPVGESVVVDAVAGFDFPVVVKPNSATRGAGVAKADDLDSLLGVVDHLNLIHDFPATGDKSYLIQEFLPDARDYRGMVVDGSYVGAVRRELPDGGLAAGRWKHNVHRGATARGVDLDGEARELVERTAATLGIEYLGVDLLATDDRLVVNETNARPTVDAATKYEPDFYDRLADLIERVATNG